ncbi:hypothetical protein [Streptomyces sp. NPDC088249]|uniref:hypothetical protein n=1 Tax=Streptomyces sp. NPDC088249 TaxID=3365843 RepID=UPI00382DF3C1
MDQCAASDAVRRKGYETRGGVTAKGRAANVAVTIQPTGKAAMKHVESVVDTALCR